MKEIPLGAKGSFSLLVQPEHLANRFKTRSCRWCSPPPYDGKCALNAVRAHLDSGESALPPGCSFAPRCRFADARCIDELPPEVALASDHTVRCLRVADGEISLARPS
jgi:ABC-type antimicrobial peptide transport system ATPase subunit